MSYVAGCQDSGVGARTDLYDILVNLPAREIAVAPHAKGNSDAIILCLHVRRMPLHQVGAQIIMSLLESYCNMCYGEEE
jgi:hypothetical protein